MHLQIAKNAVMPFTGGRVGKKSKEKEHVTRTDPVPGKVRLRGSALTEQALTLMKHGVVMTQRGPRDPAACDLLDDIAKAEICIGCR